MATKPGQGANPGRFDSIKTAANTPYEATHITLNAEILDLKICAGAAHSQTAASYAKWYWAILSQYPLMVTRQTWDGAAGCQTCVVSLAKGCGEPWRVGWRGSVPFPLVFGLYLIFLGHTEIASNKQRQILHSPIFLLSLIIFFSMLDYKAIQWIEGTVTLHRDWDYATKTLDDKLTYRVRIVQEKMLLLDRLTGRMKASQVMMTWLEDKKLQSYLGNPKRCIWYIRFRLKVALILASVLHAGPQAT